MRRILARCSQNVPQTFEHVYFSLTVHGNLKWKTGLNLCDYSGTCHSKFAANFCACLLQPPWSRQSQMENGPETLRRMLARCIQNVPQSFGPVYFTSSLPVPGNLKWKTGLKLCGNSWNIALKMCRKVLGPFTSALLFWPSQMGN